MVVVQFVFAGVNIFYKLAVSDGMDMRGMGVMDGMKPVAAMVVVQFVFAGVNIFYKLAVSDGMDMRVLVAYRFLFASAVLSPIAYFVERGSLAQNLYISGMKLTSATFASAMTNLIPAITFVLAVLFRYERLAIRTLAGLAKARLSREYPFHYSTTALMCAMSALQSAAFALCFDRDPIQWRLSSGVRLLAVLYTGVVASGVMLVVLSWCVKWRGPLFASVFNPMMLVVVAVLSSLLLGEELHLGSVLGAVLIVTGLYSVLWGKGREAAENEPAKARASGTELPHIDIVVHRHDPPPTPQQQSTEPGPAR
uniref:WAT1-related protein n=1 Tax=Aegilops tauschii TaxID=37682 RepID=R7WFY5_AEGTA